MQNLENKVYFPKLLNGNIAGTCYSGGKMGKKGKIKCAGVHKGLTGDMGMPIQNDNAVVQVPLSNLEVRICAYVPLTIDTPCIFF